jgi:hypothetical protein
MEAITGIEIPIEGLGQTLSKWIFRFSCGFPKFRSRNRRLCFSFARADLIDPSDRLY